VPSETPFWVPHERSFLRRAIEQAAGIVGHRHAGGPSRSGMIRIYWVGKHSAAGAPVTFADRVVRAWHLMEVSYPTTCRLAVDEGDLEPVGLYDTRTGELQVKEWSNQPDAPELLAAWLGVDELPDEELRLSAVAVRSPFAEDDD
jgi:hypothetical protein